MRQAVRYERDKTHVAVFGAGIAGLTAAHELVERGFKVEVWEAAAPSRVDRLDDPDVKCAVGGMARTQWSQVLRRHGEPDMQRAMPLEDYLDDEKFRFERGTADFKPGEEARLEEKLKKLTGKVISGELGHLRTLGFVGAPFDPHGARLDRKRAERVKEVIERVFPGGNITVAADGCGVGCDDDWTAPEDARDYAIVQVEDSLLPGEHGFRFFPAFYRHIFDTMSRTPIPDEDQEPYLETARTVLDNVVQTEFMGFSTTRTKRLLRFHREPVRSVQELFDELCQALKTLGHTLDDINRYQLMLFKYMTSGPRRRRRYEDMSWSEFVGAAEFTPAFQTYLESTAETLVGMVASRADARTYGTISAQMMLDQISDGARVQHVDGTLNGPTTMAWFSPWRKYLEVQGVVFRRGKLVEFDVHDEGDGPEPFPVVDTEPDQSGGKRLLLSRDYYVLALPPTELQRLAHAHHDRLQGEDFDRVRRFNLGDPASAVTGGALEHMCGIQFYLPTKFDFLRGHVIFPDTAWRLSAISQPQFWVQKRGGWSGYRGIISVDVSNFSAVRVDKHASRSAWNSTARQLADGVWHDISSVLVEKTLDAETRKRGHQDAHGTSRVPKPLYFHVDDNLKYQPNDGPVARNESPYLLTLKQDFARRPGTPGRYTLDRSQKIVMAGILMQTFTRLTTMESANESGRHAVNCILDASHFQGERSAVWDPERHEPPDLHLLIEIDEQLAALNLPHLVDILDLREVPRALLRPDPDVTALAPALRGALGAP